MKTNFYQKILLFIAVFLLFTEASKGQYISLSESSGFRGKSMTVTIYGNGVTFSQSSSTVCPSLLHVGVEDVVFRQGSFTSFYPDSIQINPYNGSIQADVTIPNNIPGGYYELVVGNTQPCHYSTGFYVNEPSINSYPSSVSIGQTIEVQISGYGLTFSQSSPTLCPERLNVSASNIFFQQGSTTIFPTYIYSGDAYIVAGISIPKNIPSGYYNLIVGAGEACPMYNYSALFITGPTISVNNSFGIKSQNLSVSISGYGVDFTQSSSTICPDLLKVTASDMVFRQGSYTVHPYGVQLTSNNRLLADIYFPESAPIGYYDVTVGEGESCSLTQPFAFYLSGPYISSYNYGTQNQSLPVSIYGTGVQFTQGSPTICPGQLQVTTSNVFFRQGSSTIYPSSLTNVSGNYMEAIITIPPTAAIGYYDLYVGSPDLCQQVSRFALVVNPGYFILASPKQATQGDKLSVTISGPNINFSSSSSTICPDFLNVDVSNVALMQGSSTILHPTEVIAQGHELIAYFDISNHTPAGTYDLLVNGGYCQYSTPFTIHSKKDKGNPATPAYPNPSDGSSVTFELTREGTFEISLHDKQGTEILRTTATGPDTINLEALIGKPLDSGIYILNVYDNKKKYSQKIVVQ